MYILGIWYTHTVGNIKNMSRASLERSKKLTSKNFQKIPNILADFPKIDGIPTKMMVFGGILGPTLDFGQVRMSIFLTAPNLL